MSLNIGRKGQLYVKAEASYGDAATTIASANAVRHINLGMAYDPYQRVTSPEKKVSPGPVNRFNRRTMAGLQTLEALIRPSGTLNTIPEIDEILKAAFGAKQNITLATTVLASPAPTTTSATLASTTGLVVGQGISIVVSSLKYVRIIQSLPGSDAVTWAPALPSAPATGAVVKGAISYTLTTDLALSLYMAHYLSNFSRALFGVGIDKFNLGFDGTEEARISCSGPAKTQGTPAQSQPGAFTSVGGNPPNGLVGELYINDTAYLHKALSIDVTNNVRVRNVEAGNAGLATELYRAGRREATVSLEAFVETEASLYDLTEAGTNAKVFRQNGRTEGSIIAIYMPKVEFKPADTSDDDEETNWQFRGLALESADGANDEVVLVLA